MINKTKVQKIKILKKFFSLITLFFLFESQSLIKAQVPDIKKTWDLSSKLNQDYFQNNNDLEFYLIGPGDVIKIINKEFENLQFQLQIDQKPKNENLFVVDGNGQIYHPKLKYIYVSGLNLNELKSLLNNELKKFYRNIDIDIELNLVRLKPAKIMISGEVNQPGIYNLYHLNTSQNQDIPKNPIIKDIFSAETLSENDFYTNQTDLFIPSPYPTVYDAISRSGGITNYSNLSQIEIIRKNPISNGGGKVKAEINLLSLFEDFDTSQNIRLYDGDIINISKSTETSIGQISKAIKSNLNPKFINVIVTGRVEKPGIKSVPKLVTLNDVIDIAGGARPIKGKVSFIRVNSDGSVDRRRFNYGKNKKRGNAKNPYLQQGDIIHIEQGRLSTLNEIVSEITKPFIGIYSTYKIFD